ncbi:MAG: hypothetical protein QM589_06045 [Thermomicrobiales bacterium]
MMEGPSGWTAGVCGFERDAMPDAGGICSDKYRNLRRSTATTRHGVVLRVRL